MRTLKRLALTLYVGGVVTIFTDTPILLIITVFALAAIADGIADSNQTKNKSV